ncbi:MAG: flagellar basal-body MS-ring/collar protein FliF, partial [bacterium]
MADWLSEYIEQIGDIWENLNRRAQITILIGMVGVFLGLVFLIIFAGEGDYAVLFSQLDPEDADAIVNNLEEQGIPYKLENNGATIKVPADQLHKTRLDMAGEGLPGKGLVGFEIFDESQFGTTDFERKVNFNRALGGELSRSIQSLESVKQARVQVTASEESLFKENQEPAKASVLLELNPGVTLDNSQIKAISNLVSSGVEDLESENVTVVDNKGNLLTADGDSSGSFQDSEINYTSNLDYQQQFEKGLQTDLEKLLTRVLGPGNFAVQVRARINFDREEMESKEFSPVVDDEGILRSQEENTERQEGGSSDEGGSPGTDSNLPQYQAEEEEGESSSYQSSDSVSNFEINERITRQSYAPGQVERLSVSVMVDNDLSAEQRDAIENSVQAAIGYDSER